MCFPSTLLLCSDGRLSRAETVPRLHLAYRELIKKECHASFVELFIGSNKQPVNIETNVESGNDPVLV